MNPFSPAFILEPSDFPRASGDEPWGLIRLIISRKFSPREWG